MPSFNQINAFIHTALTGGGAAGATTEHKAKWLLELEKAELANALKKFQVVKAGIQAKSDQDANNNQHNDVARNIKPDEPELTKSIYSSGRDDNNRATGLSEPVAMKLRAPVNAMTHDLAVTGQLIKQVLETSELRPGSSQLTSPVLSAKSHLFQWSAQNIAVLRSGENVEVWIRDASLSKTKLTEILKEIQLGMGSLGASLVRVTLNGKDVLNKQGARVRLLSAKDIAYGS